MDFKWNDAKHKAGAVNDSDIPVEDHYQLLIDAVQDYAIFILDPDSRVASWNSGARKIKGYSTDEIIGRHFSVFYTTEDVAPDKPWRELAIAAARKRADDQGWRVRRDGSRFWADVTITAVHDLSGALLGFAKVTRDMTERMRLAELEHSSELAARIQSTCEDEQMRTAHALPWRSTSPRPAMRKRSFISPPNWRLGRGLTTRTTPCAGPSYEANRPVSVPIKSVAASAA